MDFRLPVNCNIKDVPKLLPTGNDVETVVHLINQNAKAKHHMNIGVDAEDYYIAA